MGIKRTILIAEDQKINRTILNDIFSEDYEILMAENGAEAVWLLQTCQSKISAILLDIVMPKMDGYEVLKIIKSDEKFSDIPVIIITQMEGDDSQIKALKLGADDFIAKPFNPEIIKIKLEKIIQINEAAQRINDFEKDKLTGLLSKDGFYHRVSELFKDQKDGDNSQNEKKYKIIAIDMEKFKIYNDLFGANSGDALLKSLAEGLKNTFVNEDDYICRRYADQFFVCTGDANFKEKIEKLSDSFKNRQETANVIIKFGIYEINNTDITVRNMCDRAMLALNSIKGRYDKYYCFYKDKMREILLDEQSITSVMNKALKNRQFEIYYQPKVDANKESVVGAEALIRWVHPQKGFISPGIFIPLFEKNGFITELDKYVWEGVCEFLSDLKKKNDIILPISVNVSRKDIENIDIVKIFTDLIKKYELEPQYVHLEITETAYMENTQQFIDVINKLKEIGFVVEMDDFGSGYSSLNMLSVLPIDVLKLDMQLIQNEFASGNSSSIISTIINLARWMNLLVIAEGVETKEQLEYLKKMKCNIIQGFYFAEPMPGHKFVDFLKSREINPVFDMAAYLKYTMNESEEPKDSNIMLVVDDLALNRVILYDYFKSDFNVVQVSNGEDAWNYIQDNYQKITIIMLDLYMPGMDGFALLENIKKDSRYKNIPVVITSSACEKFGEKLLENHADGFLTKPYVREDAINAVMHATKN